jgi:hypothetical protein
MWKTWRQQHLQRIFLGRRDDETELNKMSLLCTALNSKCRSTSV